MRQHLGKLVDHVLEHVLGRVVQQRLERGQVDALLDDGLERALGLTVADLCGSRRDRGRERGRDGPWGGADQGVFPGSRLSDCSLSDHLAWRDILGPEPVPVNEQDACPRSLRQRASQNK